MDRRIPALDGVRGAAIILVILFHHTVMEQATIVDRVYVNIARFGWSGVDLFFVLSGFLITGILYDTKGGPHYFRNFYARRVLRIFPLYYAFVFFVLKISPWLWPDTGLAAMARANMEGRSEAWYWLYLSNIFFAREEGFAHPNLAVTWSLAIEEQFYLLWPLLVLAAARRSLMWICGGLIATALAARILLVTSGTDSTVPYVLPFCRMDALAAGGFVALALRDPRDRASVIDWAPYLAGVGLTLIALIWYLEGPLDDRNWTEPLMQTAGYSLFAILYAALVALLAGGRDDSKLSRFFSNAVLRTFGTYSYALYLFHVPIRRWIRDEYFPVADFHTWMGSPLPGQLLFYVVATAPAFVLAAISWHLFEQPILGLRRYFPYGRLR